jgi:hypothetical protein
MFTFIHTGGSIKQITVLPIVRTASARDDILAIRQAYEKFDVELCKCFCQEDKGRMLEIIAAAFGDMTQFNNAIRSLLGDSGPEFVTLLYQGHADAACENSA